MAEDVATCQRCGREVASAQLKELVYERGPEKERVTEMVCPNCLDKAMNEADEVRGVAGQHKQAAAHIKGERGEGERESFSERT